MRKKIADRDEAKFFVKEINERAHRIAQEVNILSAQLNELKNFVRSDSEQYKSYTNANQMRTACSELIRHDRKMAQILPTLKVLAFSSYPEPIIKEEEVVERESFNKKVDKRAKPLRKITRPPTEAEIAREEDIK